MAQADCSEGSILIPLSTKEHGCLKKLNNLSLKLEKIDTESKAYFDVEFLNVEFTNIPHESVIEYLSIHTDPQTQDTKLNVISFLCSGEIPLDGDAYSENLQNMVGNNHPSSNHNVFISTGQAAENISASQRNKAKTKIYDNFVSLYEANHNERIDINNDDIYIPNILAGLSRRRPSETEQKNYSDYFARTGSSINGCSKKFKNKMSGYLIKNILNKHPFLGVKVKKKNISHHLELIWDAQAIFSSGIEHTSKSQEYLL